MNDMNNVKTFSLPDEFDWQAWITRWDKMQERYIVKRAERFEIMTSLIRQTQNPVQRIVDLGCGTGSLMLEMLYAFPKAKIMGIDFDPTLLPLAQNRLAKFGNRVNLLFEDLRQDNWLQHFSEPVDAVVSATALHWLEKDELTNLYYKIAKILRTGGIFLNADHVGSTNKKIQQAWENSRQDILNRQENTGPTWEVFWSEYINALGLKSKEVRQRVLNGWKGGVEEGMSLDWHFERLKAAGFVYIDCFWRSDCDAIYGGINSERNNWN